jgi:hypothetical protein
MIHAICDMCGRDCNRTAYFVSVTPFQNFGRYRSDTEPYGHQDPVTSMVLCENCLEAKIGLSLFKDRLVESLACKCPTQHAEEKTQ